MHDENGGKLVLQFTAHVKVILDKPEHQIAAEVTGEDESTTLLFDDKEEESGSEMGSKDASFVVQPRASTNFDTDETITNWYDLYISSKCCNNPTINVADKTPSQKYFVLELFAGCGGLALGMEQAGFKSVGLVEIDRHCCSTLTANRPSWNVKQADIWSVLKDNAYLDSIRQSLNGSELDVMTGGFPCQSFSTLGKQQGFEDARGQMYMAFAELVKMFRPKIVIGENVKGLVGHDQGKTLANILHEFAKHGYKMHWKIMDANEYGVPQRRIRLLIIGVRLDIAELAPFMFPSQLDDHPTLRHALCNPPVPDSPFTAYPEKKRLLYQYIKQGQNWTSLSQSDLEKHGMVTDKKVASGKLYRLTWDKPCLTILTTPSSAVAERCHPEHDRPLTLRETARVQTFPDTWEIKGPIGSAYKQLGNAVPVQLAKMVGLSVAQYLDTVERIMSGNTK